MPHYSRNFARRRYCHLFHSTWTSSSSLSQKPAMRRDTIPQLKISTLIHARFASRPPFLDGCNTKELSSFLRQRWPNQTYRAGNYEGPLQRRNFQLLKYGKPHVKANENPPDADLPRILGEMTSAATIIQNQNEKRSHQDRRPSVSPSSLSVIFH